MKNNIAFLYSNNQNLSCQIAREISDEMSIGLYLVENRAALLLEEEGPLKEKIIEEFGEDSYVDGRFNVTITNGLDFSTSPKLTKIQDFMNDVIVDELRNLTGNIIVVSNQIIEAGLLHLSDNLIVVKFKDNTENYGEYINIDSIKEICSHYIEPEDSEDVTISIRGCLIDCWGY